MITTRPELRGDYGMVASTQWLASSVGMSVLERGGNAFDAAVAAGFVLQVIEPHLNGPGGEVPIILYSSTSRRVVVINGQGPATRAATIDHFRQLGLDLVPGTGLLAACVPGAIDAWLLLLRDFGSLPLRDVLSYAIGYAERGYPVAPRMTEIISTVAAMFQDAWPTSAALYLGNGIPASGSVFRNPTLARTYRRLVEEAERVSPDRERQIDAARDAFYRGWVAQEIVDFAADGAVLDSSGRSHTGLLTLGDFATYAAVLENPTMLDYHGHTVCKTGVWGQGPVFLQQLALLAGFDLTAMGHNSVEFIHTVVECAKLAFADREAWYGDPLFVDVPLADLLNPAYADERRKLVAWEASSVLRPGAPGGHVPKLPVASELPQPASGAAAGTGEPSVTARGETRGDTSHLDVIDRFGNVVTAMPSGGWLQSSPTIPNLGFCLGTRGQIFWLKDGLPNSLAGGKRPRTTLTPSLVMRGDEPYLAFGTPGGDTQDQWGLVFFLTHLHFGLGLQAAIDAAMFHTEHFPSSFYPRGYSRRSLIVEGRIKPEVIAGLRNRGHDVTVVGDWALGWLSAVGRDPNTGLLMAGANPRDGQGYAVGR